MNQPLVSITVNGQPAGAVSRRRAMQWVLASVAAAGALPTGCAPRRKDALAPPPSATQPAASQPPTSQSAITADGYGTDPDLLKIYKPGDVWPLTFTPEQSETAAALADLILPDDALGPAASKLGVPAMVDEWISAPYPIQQADRQPILEGFAWLNAEAATRFAKPFAGLSTDEQSNIADDICNLNPAGERFKQPAIFFARFRALCAGAYYSTPPGWEAIGYVGNVALVSYDGPPTEVLEKVGVTQTVA